jgi:hypothetical protein
LFETISRGWNYKVEGAFGGEKWECGALNAYWTYETTSFGDPRQEHGQYIFYFSGETNSTMGYVNSFVLQ